MTEYQRCIVHVVRNTLKYVANKDKKAFTNDLKTIYQAPDESGSHARVEAVVDVWNKKYPGCMNRWKGNWDVISPMFKFSRTVRKALYLATHELTKKWTLPIRNWGAIYAELSVMYPGRLTEA